MKRKRNLLLIVLIISSLFLILTPKSVVGSIADIHYTFKNDVLYSNFNSTIAFTDSFNTKDILTQTQLYNASYSFTDDTNYDNPLGFTVGETGGSVNVIPSFDNHDKVLELNNTVGADSVNAIQTFAVPQVSGSYELWIQVDDATPYTYFYGVGGAGNGVRVYIVLDDFHAHGHGAIVSCLDDTWYHVKFDFECGAGGYLGLGADTYFMTINGVKYGAFNFNTALLSITKIFFLTSTTVINKDYFDGIGYSWLSNYTINTNILPIVETDTSIKELDRYEWALETNNTLYSIGDDTASGWVDFDDGNDNVNVIADPNDINDRVIEIDTNAPNDIKQWRKLDFTSTNEFINITAGFNITTFTGTTSYFGIVLVASDTINPPAGIYIYQNGDLELETGTGYHVVRSDVSAGHFYEINLLLNYEIDIFILQWFIDGVLDATYQYKLVSNGLNGLSKVYFYNKWIDDQNTVYVDYCGIYESGVSIANEYAWSSLNLGVSNWDFRKNNLFTQQLNGYIHMSSIEGSYAVGESVNIVNDFFLFTNITTLQNIYDNYVSIVPNPTFIFTFSGTNFSVNQLDIEGVKLIQSFNEYFLEYSHSGIETNESYFFVDVNNRLQFILLTNDTDTEYIQATFDIPNLSSTDRAISFRGSIIAKAFGYFFVDYITGLTTVEIPIFEKTTRSILPANKTINNFIVLITDNDIDSIIGTTTGFVSQPILLSISGIGLPIITAGLIEMMIPLIMIMIPTLLISNGFGKEGKKLIIPLFLVFSLITTIALTIPIWIFFIIIFGIGLFLARNKEIEVN